MSAATHPIALSLSFTHSLTHTHTHTHQHTHTYTGHFGHSWFRTHNLHSALHDQGQRQQPSSHQSSSPQPSSPHSTDTATPPTQHSQPPAHIPDTHTHTHTHTVGHRAGAGDNDDGPHRDPATHEHLTLHERNRLMEGKAGGYKFLSPQERWAHQEYDAIQSAEEARARESAELKAMQTAFNRAKAAFSDSQHTIDTDTHPPHGEPPPIRGSRGRTSRGGGYGGGGRGRGVGGARESSDKGESLTHPIYQGFFLSDHDMGVCLWILECG